MANNNPVKPSILSRIVDRAGRNFQKEMLTVMIGVVSSEFCAQDFAVTFGTVCAKPGALISVSSRMADLNFPVPILRNSLVEEAKTHKVDRLLLLNGDMAFPPSLLSGLLEWGDRDVVGAIYRNRMPPFNLIVGAKDGVRMEAKKGIVEVDILPLGATLIKMSVFDKIGAPYFREPFSPSTADHPGGIVPDFVDFSNRVREAGMKLWADIDMSAQVGHVGKNLFMAQEEYGDPRIAGQAA